MSGNVDKINTALLLFGEALQWTCHLLQSLTEAAYGAGESDVVDACSGSLDVSGVFLGPVSHIEGGLLAILCVIIKDDLGIHAPD